MKTDDLIRALVQDTPTEGGERRKNIGLLAGAAIISALLVLLAFGLRDDLAHEGALATLRKLAFTLLALAAGAHGALVLMRPEARPRAVTAWLMAPAAAIFLFIALDVGMAGASNLGARVMGSSALQCVLSVSALAALPLAALLMGMREGATTTPATAGAFAGLASGALAASLYALHCTDDSPLFVGVWYGLAIALVAAAGALAGRRALRW